MAKMCAVSDYIRKYLGMTDRSNFDTTSENEQRYFRSTCSIMRVSYRHDVQNMITTITFNVALFYVKLEFHSLLWILWCIQHITLTQNTQHITLTQNIIAHGRHWLGNDNILSPHFCINSEWMLRVFQI